MSGTRCGTCRGRGTVRELHGLETRQCDRCGGAGVRRQSSVLGPHGRAATGAAEKTCAHCAAVFHVYPYRTLTAKYCSRKCGAQAGRAAVIAAYPPRDEVAHLVQVECLTDRELGGRFGHSYQWALLLRRHYGIEGWPQGASQNQRRGKMSRWIDSEGYVGVMHPEYGQTREHRLVAEAKIGRRLREGEVVHHVDGDRANNHPDNLMVFGSQGEHLRFEAARRPKKKRNRAGETAIYKVFNVGLKGENRCRNCGAGRDTTPIHLHHAVPRSRSRAGRVDMRNGVPLCARCHRGWHGRTVTIYRDVFTADEWAFISSLENPVWLDDRYPARQAVTA